MSWVYVVENEYEIDEHGHEILGVYASMEAAEKAERKDIEAFKKEWEGYESCWYSDCYFNTGSYTSTWKVIPYEVKEKA